MSATGENDTPFMVLKPLKAIVCSPSKSSFSKTNASPGRKAEASPTLYFSQCEGALAGVALTRNELFAFETSVPK